MFLPKCFTNHSNSDYYTATLGVLKAEMVYLLIDATEPVEPALINICGGKETMHHCTCLTILLIMHSNSWLWFNTS
jgi:hypothetical protein